MTPAIIRCLEAARKTYRAEDFKVGQRVRKRWWTVPPYPMPQQPQVSKRTGVITAITLTGITVSGLGIQREYDAFELVPA